MEELQAGDPLRIGPYAISARLGAGGMGQVFLGQSPGGRLVAVKVIHPEWARDKEFRARFAREVAVARTVGGFFTAPVVDADTEATQPWLATGFVDGPSLAGAVAEHGPMPEESLLVLAAGLAEGLSAVHAADVVHRDLKPSNVLLARDGLRVMDFGIAQAADGTALTGTGRVIGSPAFMSPEQAQGHGTGPASDVFSMGSVVVFAATGAPPFGAGSGPEQLFRVVYHNPRLDGLPASLRSLIARCLDKDPAARPGAPQFLAELPPVAHARPARSTHIDWWPVAMPVLSDSAAEVGPAAAQPSPAAHPSSAESAAQAASGSLAPGGTQSANITVPPRELSEALIARAVSVAPPPPGYATAPSPRLPDDGGPRRRQRTRRWLIVAAAVAAPVLAFAGLFLSAWIPAQSKYYLGVDDGNMAIFHGVHETFLGMSLSSAYQRSNVPLAQLPVSAQRALIQTIATKGLSDAHGEVASVVAVVGQCRAQWHDLAAWKTANDAYHRDLVVYNQRLAHLKPGQEPPAPPVAPGLEPQVPQAASCGPASAFGIRATALPPGSGS